MQVWNDVGEADSEDGFILVEAVDIFAMIERHLETKRITLKSLFMQFLRSQVSPSVLQGTGAHTLVRLNIREWLSVVSQNLLPMSDLCQISGLSLHIWWQ